MAPYPAPCPGDEPPDLGDLGDGLDGGFDTKLGGDRIDLGGDRIDVGGDRIDLDDVIVRDPVLGDDEDDLQPGDPDEPPAIPAGDTPPAQWLPFQPPTAPPAAPAPTPTPTPAPPDEKPSNPLELLRAFLESISPQNVLKNIGPK